MVEQLKPCPFCGGEPDIIEPDDADYGEIRCGACDVVMEVYSDTPGLIAAWNRRAPPAQPHETQESE